MPNPLLAPALVSAGASLAGGLVGSLTSRSAAKKQFEYQQALQQQAQEYSRENATTAYNRQRDLTKDNALLQLQGMRAAGFSTAFSDGSSVPAAANVDQGATPSPGSAPSVMSLAESFNQGASAASALADLAVKTAQVQNVQSDTEGKDIDNDFKAAKYKAEIDEMMSRTKGYKFDNSLKEFSLGLEKKYGERRVAAQTAQAEAEALIKGSAAFYSDALNEADLDKRRQEIEVLLSQKDLNEQTKKNLEGELSLLDEKREELRSRAYANYGAGADSYSHVEVNKTQADLNRANKGLVVEQTEGQGLENSFNRGTMEARKNLVIDASNIQSVEAEVSHITREAVLKEARRKADALGPQSVSEWCWRVANNWENESLWNRFKCYLGIMSEAAAPAVGAFGAGIGAGLGAGVTGAFTPKPVKVGGFRK